MTAEFNVDILVKLLVMSPLHATALSRNFLVNFGLIAIKSLSFVDLESAHCHSLSSNFPYSAQPGSAG